MFEDEVSTYSLSISGQVDKNNSKGTITIATVHCHQITELENYGRTCWGEVEQKQSRERCRVLGASGQRLVSMWLRTLRLPVTAPPHPH